MKKTRIFISDKETDKILDKIPNQRKSLYIREAVKEFSTTKLGEKIIKGI